MLFDTHLHLTQLATTRPGCNLASKFLSVSTGFEDAKTNLSFAKLYPNSVFAIGLHPWNVDTNWQTEINSLRSLLEKPCVGAIGEIGLDFSGVRKQTKSIQLQAFEQQLAIAKEFDLPVSLHIFKAYDDAYQLLKHYQTKGVMHGFAGGYQQALRFIQLGLKIGIGTNLLRVNAPRYFELVQKIDLKHLVIETDAPFSLATDLDFDEQLQQILLKISELKNLPFKQVEQQIYQTSLETFNLTDMNL